MADKIIAIADHRYRASAPAAPLPASSASYLP
jgi:hypothetical protein